MAWTLLLMVACLVSAGTSINRRVYKIVLTQKGYAQFLQYDVATPPLREFTFCTWIRIHDLTNEQSIFTYVAPESGRVVRLWFSAVGRRIFITIRGKVSSVVVDLVKNTWRHVCFSYQSDYGAWALYIDARTLSCSSSRNLVGYVIPGDGSVIFGYGASEDGAPNGLEGEIFGANMILASTIERNHSTKNNPRYEQKYFTKNKMKDNNGDVKYVVLNDLYTEEGINNFQQTEIPSNRTQNYVNIKTPHSFIEHSVGIDPLYKKPHFTDYLNKKQTVPPPGHINKMSFWSLINKANPEQKLKTTLKVSDDFKIINLGAQKSKTISQYETPPPMSNQDYFYLKTFEIPKAPILQPNFEYNNNIMSFKKKCNSSRPTESLQLEPPPPPEKKSKVYGQWTNSNFSGNVLNYLKSINFHTKEQKKVPSTIPLTKISDSFPYSSDFRFSKLRPPAQFKRRNLLETRFRRPEINVKILQNDIRKEILKSHAYTQPKYVEITNRGQNSHRFYRNVTQQRSSNHYNNSHRLDIPKPFTLLTAREKRQENVRNHNNFSLLTILPFLKSVEYFIEDTEPEMKSNAMDENDIYLNSLSNENKWHNIKLFDNDHKARGIIMKSNSSNMNNVKTEINKKRTSHKSQGPVQPRNAKLTEDQRMDKARKLAMEVSKKSETITDIEDSIPIYKYNHGFLPGHDEKMKTLELINSAFKTKVKKGNTFGNTKSNFNKPIKIGNALNEKFIIGSNIEQNEKSFVDGDEAIPDINKYRSDIDNVNENVPSSLGPRTCISDGHGRTLYVQPDQSIDVTNIISPIKTRNLAAEFVLESYKICSLEESSLERSPLLFIDWNKTPVRLFGGAHPKKTKDLCGFF